jgi:hypothetical protein
MMIVLINLIEYMNIMITLLVVVSTILSIIIYVEKNT